MDSFVEYSLFYRSLLKKRFIILSMLLSEANACTHLDVVMQHESNQWMQYVSNPLIWLEFPAESSLRMKARIEWYNLDLT